MALLDDLIASVGHEGVEVRDIVTGPFWTLAATTHCGVAGLPDDREGTAREVSSDLGAKTVSDLLELAFSQNASEASIGIATLNSLIIGQRDPSHFRPYRIPTARDKRVAVVGDFPFIEHLETIAQHVCVIEKNLTTNDYAGTEAQALLADADIALITGSAIVDHTMEQLLSFAGPCYTIVFGPSTPLSPILFTYGANQLVGVRIKDEASVKKCIRDGLKNLSECPGVESVVMEALQQAS